MRKRTQGGQGSTVERFKGFWHQQQQQQSSSNMSVIMYPPIVFVEPTQKAALALVDSCSISYAGFSVPVPFVEDAEDVLTCDVLACDVLQLGDVLLSLHVVCDGLKAVDFSVLGVSLHSGYFLEPRDGSYEINIPICLLNVPKGAVTLLIARIPGGNVHSIVATYILVRSEERLARASMMADGDRHMNTLDVAIDNGNCVALAFFNQDADN